LRKNRFRTPYGFTDSANTPLVRGRPPAIPNETDGKHDYRLASERPAIPNNKINNKYDALLIKLMYACLFFDGKARAIVRANEKKKIDIYVANETKIRGTTRAQIAIDERVTL